MSNFIWVPKIFPENLLVHKSKRLVILWVTQNKVPLCRPELIAPVSGCLSENWLLETTRLLWPNGRPSRDGLGRSLFCQGDILSGYFVGILGWWVSGLTWKSLVVSGAGPALFSDRNVTTQIRAPNKTELLSNEQASRSKHFHWQFNSSCR